MLDGRKHVHDYEPLGLRQKSQHLGHGTHYVWQDIPGVMCGIHSAQDEDASDEEASPDAPLDFPNSHILDSPHIIPDSFNGRRLYSRAHMG
jgi:hypothetical protein